MNKDTSNQVARGCMFGLLFALPIWAGIILLLWLIVG